MYKYIRICHIESMSNHTTQVLRIAHRGASGYAPENTLKAYQKALYLGADMIEIDVRRTRDRHLVAFHDMTLKRLTQGRGLLRSYTYHELKKFDIGGEEIPHLSDVLSLLRGKCQINIEIKEHGLAEDVVTAVKEYGMEDDVLFSSYLHFELLKVKELDSNMRIALLFFTRPYFVQMPIRLGLQIGAEALNFQMKKKHKRFILKVIASAEEQNLKINVYTVNDPEDITWLKNAGVHGIISDYPDRI